jgi:hypothetical protein
MKAKKKDPKKRNSLPQEASAAVAGGRGGALSPEVATFRGDQVKLLAKSGWNCCSSIREGLRKVNRPVPAVTYLEAAFTSKQWTRAYQATSALRNHFKDARSIDQATFGILLVPDPNKFDTRGAVNPAIRRDQTELSGPDIMDKRLPAGKTVTKPGIDWTLVATITSAAGIFLGSYNDVRTDSSTLYTVDGIDTRKLMVRQIWGARVLQSGNELPDSDARASWTFTVFPGEEQIEGSAPSGTILFGRVRFRLGRSDCGISVVRVCPAIVIEGGPTGRGISTVYGHNVR